MSVSIQLCPRCGARAPFHTDNCGAWMQGDTTSPPNPQTIKPEDVLVDTSIAAYVRKLEEEGKNLRAKLQTAEAALRDADLLLGHDWKRAVEGVRGNAEAAAERRITALVGDLEELREKLQTAEQQIADTQKEFGRIQGTSAKQVVDRFLDLMRKLNEKDLPAGFESWEAYGKYIDGIKQRAQVAEQQLGQVREEVKDAKLILERVSKRGACEAFNTQGVFRGCQVFRENGKLRCVRCEALLFLQRTATPSDGCGKGRTEVPAFLREMAEQLRTQDNLCTSQPLYCVMAKDRIYGIDMDFDPGYAWIDQTSGDYVEATEDEAKQLEAMDEAGEKTILDGCEYEKTGFVDKERFITASLTQAGAEEHIRLNGHNIRGAYIYVTSLYRTPDMIALREWILSLAASSDGKGVA